MSQNDGTGLCKITAWQNDPTGDDMHQVAVTRGFGTDGTTGPSFTASDGLHFIANELAPFKIGGGGGAASCRGGARRARH